MDTITAWHFTGDKLRDGRALPPIGEWLTHEGKIELCASGFHASECAFDALSFAPGPIVHRVELRGDIIRGDDKLVARERRILWSADATETLRAFARAQALKVVHLWKAPDVVRRYLETGDESLRAAARAAAWDAAWDAARAAARDAARAAARAAALAAAWDAAWDAARAAARAAAWDAHIQEARADLTARLLALAPEMADAR